MDEAVQERFRRQGLPFAAEDAQTVPPPVLWSESAPYLVAFKALSRARQAGFESAQAIPFSEIESWLNLNGRTDPGTRSMYVRLLRVMDEYVLERRREQAEVERKKREAEAVHRRG